MHSQNFDMYINNKASSANAQMPCSHEIVALLTDPTLATLAAMLWTLSNQSARSSYTVAANQYAPYLATTALSLIHS